MTSKPHSELAKTIRRGLAWEPSWSENFGKGKQALAELEEQLEAMREALRVIEASNGLHVATLQQIAYDALVRDAASSPAPERQDA